MHKVESFAIKELAWREDALTVDVFKISTIEEVRSLTHEPSDDPRFSTGPLLNDRTWAEALYGNKLVMLHDALDLERIDSIPVTDYRGGEYWISEPITSEADVCEFFWNQTVWINPIAHILPADAPLVPNAIIGIVIKAYDDDGFILVKLGPRLSQSAPGDAPM